MWPCTTMTLAGRALPLCSLADRARRGSQSAGGFLRKGVIGLRFPSDRLASNGRSWPILPIRGVELSRMGNAPHMEAAGEEEAVSGNMQGVRPAAVNHVIGIAVVRGGRWKEAVTMTDLTFS